MTFNCDCRSIASAAAHPSSIVQMIVVRRASAERTAWQPRWAARAALVHTGSARQDRSSGYRRENRSFWDETATSNVSSKSLPLRQTFITYWSYCDIRNSCWQLLRLGHNPGTESRLYDPSPCRETRVTVLFSNCVPVGLTKFVGRREIKASLRTSDAFAAKMRGRVLSNGLEILFQRLQAQWRMFRTMTL